MPSPTRRAATTPPAQTQTQPVGRTPRAGCQRHGAKGAGGDSIGYFKKKKRMRPSLKAYTKLGLKKVHTSAGDAHRSGIWGKRATA